MKIIRAVFDYYEEDYVLPLETYVLVKKRFRKKQIHSKIGELGSGIRVGDKVKFEKGQNKEYVIKK